MQSIDECMEEVALQMQMQMPKRQEDKDTFEHDEFQCQYSSFNDPNGVQQAEDDLHAVDLLSFHHDSSENVAAVASDALFQVLNICLGVKLSPDSDRR